MYSIIQTAIVEGIHTIPVQVEVDISAGLPTFEMVGYLSSEVKEARERVRTALHNCGINLPPNRITMNLSPAYVRKSGTGFDLPIAAALLCSLGIIPEEVCRDVIFVGELNLNGQILPVNGILPIVSDAVENGARAFIIPQANLSEAKLVKEALVFGFSGLREMIDFLQNGDYEEEDSPVTPEKKAHSYDFSEVNGQRLLKRACEVSAAGMHNMLMIGPPGGGKTMISERMKTILPPLTESEKLELSKIYSVKGLLTGKGELLHDRPFRNPHHTITRSGLIGGGLIPKPGEISLAHHGVLFLDELPEFCKNTLEVLRQPLEDHHVRLTRGNHSVEYPADFLLLAAMNPCSCGYYPDMQRCRCTQTQISRYLSQISQPLIDRIDICVQAEELSYAELTGSMENENSETIRNRVIRCHELQQRRYAGSALSYNSQIPPACMKEFCHLGEKEERYMENIYHKMRMTGRTYHKILRVARTIADLAGSENIKVEHLSEAVCYRSIDQTYWGGIR